MMTRAQLRRFIIELLVMLLISFTVLFVSHFFSSRKEQIRMQREYNAMFYPALPADRYVEIYHEMIESTEEINHVYCGYDEDNTMLGYVIDVQVEDSNMAELHLMLGVSSDGSSLTGMQRINDETNPMPYDENELVMLFDMMQNRQIPMAISLEDEGDVVTGDDDYQPLSGLQDGVYFAQSMDRDSRGYIDYVEIEIVSGRIHRVQWDGINIDPTTGSRSNSSLTGAYVVSGELWATQAYNVCHALIELQDVSRLAMMSDGTTSIIEGVTTDISAFVNLANECVYYAQIGFDKDDYLAQIYSMRGDEESTTIAEVADKVGNIVYDFSDCEDIHIEQEDDEEELVLTIYDVYLAENSDSVDSAASEENADVAGDIDEGNISETSDETTSGSMVAPTVTPQADSNNQSSATQDGYSGTSGNAVISDSVDGIPMSEVRTLLPIEDGIENASVVVTAVNTAYKFLKEYLNWVA